MGEFGWLLIFGLLEENPMLFSIDLTLLRTDFFRSDYFLFISIFGKTII